MPMILEVTAKFGKRLHAAPVATELEDQTIPYPDQFLCEEVPGTGRPTRHPSQRPIHRRYKQRCQLVGVVDGPPEDQVVVHVGGLFHRPPAGRHQYGRRPRVVVLADGFADPLLQHTVVAPRLGASHGHIGR
ncbi:hypothetical protein [Streptomyces venezuelae]|uniref:hypothetical protein n=1 Tax=Streptomyces venezuelae TaxID=54571 RepID=UPI0037D18976